MANPPRKCIFCGGGGMSNEHFWPEWAQEFTPPNAPIKHTRYVQTSVRGTPIETDSKEYQGNITKIKIKTVCKACNNHWMSELEKWGRIAMVPMIRGDRGLVSETKQRTIAKWVAMKCMVAESQHPELTVTPQDHRTQFRLQQVPPEGWKIWIGHLDEPQYGFQRDSQTFGVGPIGSRPAPFNNSLAKNTQAITFGFGHLLVFCVTTIIPGLNWHAPPNFGARLRCVWPIEGYFKWPPRQITVEEANRLANALSKASMGAPWFPGR